MDLQFRTYLVGLKGLTPNFRSKKTNSPFSTTIFFHLFIHLQRNCYHRVSVLSSIVSLTTFNQSIKWISSTCQTPRTRSWVSWSTQLGSGEERSPTSRKPVGSCWKNITRIFLTPWRISVHSRYFKLVTFLVIDTYELS